MIYLHMFGKPVIVLNSMQAANDLFEKRSSIYSDRRVDHSTRLPKIRMLMFTSKGATNNVPQAVSLLLQGLGIATDTIL